MPNLPIQSRATPEFERSDFDIPRMDCAAEEQTIRLALESADAVRELSFDLPRRRLSVWHDANAAEAVVGLLRPLGLGATLLDTCVEEALPERDTDDSQARTLWTILIINLVMFVVELSVGFAVQSTGLIADSLDMLADATVYGLSLYAVGRAASHKFRAARASGYLQLALGLGALVEAIRRIAVGSEPMPGWMMGISAIALVANTICLVLIARHRDGGAHMRASYIFSANDVLANLGVISAGALVWWTGSNAPDLVAGVLIGLLILSGAVRILRIPRP